MPRWSVDDSLLRCVLHQLANSAGRQAVEAVCGAHAYSVRAVSPLCEGGEPAQIPYADDYCNRCLFGIVQPKAGRPRRGARATTRPGIPDGSRHRALSASAT